MKRENKSTVDWIIHGVIDEGIMPGMIDAHSHGLNKYGSRELQVVLNARPYINLINEVGERIQKGDLKLHAGMLLTGFFDDDALLRVDDARDCTGEPIWRLVIPDGDNKFPEESYEEPYYLQIYSPYLEDVNETINGLLSKREKKFVQMLAVKAKYYHNHPEKFIGKKFKGGY